MRSTYSPYPQHAPHTLDPIMAEIRQCRAEIEQATAKLNECLTKHIPTLLRHHTAARPLVMSEMKELRNALHNTNISRAQVMDRVWAETMTDIERLRAVYHADLAAQKERARIEREEENSFQTDKDTGEYIFIRHMPDGSKRRTVVERDGPYWKRFGPRVES